MAHQRRVFEAAQVLAANFQDAGVWYFAVTHDLAEAGTEFVGMEAESRCMGHSGSLEAHFGMEVGGRFEMAVDHFETGSVARCEKGVLHSGIVEDRFEMEGGRSGTEEAVHFEIEVESQARSAGGIVEAAQILDFEVGQTLAAVGEMENAIVDKVIVAEHKVEGRQNRTSLEGRIQMVSAVAVAVGGSLASQPYEIYQYELDEQDRRMTHVIARTLT